MIGFYICGIAFGIIVLAYLSRNEIEVKTKEMQKVIKGRKEVVAECRKTHLKFEEVERLLASLHTYRPERYEAMNCEFQNVVTENLTCLNNLAIDGSIESKEKIDSVYGNLTEFENKILQQLKGV